MRNEGGIEHGQAPVAAGCLGHSVYRVPVHMALGAGLTALLMGCAGAIGEPRFIPVPLAADAEGVRGRDIRDYPAALSAIVQVFETHIGLPRPQVTVVLFPNRPSFRAGLIAVGYEPAFAEQSSRSFRAIGGSTGVLVNEGDLRTARWPARLQLLAHELVHCVQYVFANGERGTSEQWLREGFAEIVSMQVIDHLGLGRYRQLREVLLDPLADLRPGTMPVPLARLSTFPEWADAQVRFDVPLYAQAFVAAELLLEQHGRDALVGYFRRFGQSMDKDANFRAAFGVTLEEFDRAFAGRWQQVLAQTR